MQKLNVFWFRRDLRLDDNCGFYKALCGKYPVLPIFIFDTEILDKLSKHDARVTFIYDTLQELRNSLQEHGSSIALYYGKPKDIFKNLIQDFDIQNVITNRDYEPYAKNRDEAIQSFLAANDIGFYTFKDQVIFEKDEIVKDDGNPYVVYTPYSKKWLAKFKEMGGVSPYNPSSKLHNVYQHSRLPNLSLTDMGFSRSNIEVTPYNISKDVLVEYEDTRNFPAKASGTSQVSPHLRFGTIGIRSLINRAREVDNNTFLKELIWREFFMQILWHFPETVHQAFRKEYDRIEWRNNEEEFEKWKTGTTGYPFVDAGMRELNETGHMHNRVRMIVASFLCKHLLIDWRWGEAYFAEKLLDYEMASNVGNWQWAAGSGVDAAPYFRIFNPTTQIEKFDKERKYIKHWIKEFNSDNYPEPMVNHKEARERCLIRYKDALNK